MGPKTETLDELNARVQSGGVERGKRLVERLFDLAARSDEAQLFAFDHATLTHIEARDLFAYLAANGITFAAMPVGHKGDDHGGQGTGAAVGDGE